MTTETCLKFLAYLSNEADRHLKGGRIKDENIISLTQDVESFRKKCHDSNLSAEIKQEISKLNFNYNYKKVTAGFWLIVLAVLTIGWSALFIYYANQARRKQMLVKMRNDASSMGTRIKMNY